MKNFKIIKAILIIYYSGVCALRESCTPGMCVITLSRASTSFCAIGFFPLSPRYMWPAFYIIIEIALSVFVWFSSSDKRIIMLGC